MPTHNKNYPQTDNCCDKCYFLGTTARCEDGNCECHKVPTKIKEGWESRVEAAVLEFFNVEKFAHLPVKEKPSAANIIYLCTEVCRSELLLATSEAKREEREKIIGMVRGMKVPHPLGSIDEANNRALEDVASSLESSLGDNK